MLPPWPVVLRRASSTYFTGGTLSGPLTEPLQLGPTGLKRAALWIDEGTGNILHIAATLDDPTTTEDRIVLGAAYLDTPS